MRIVDKKRFAGFIVGTICFAIIAWVILSIIDVNIHNGTPGYEYSDANIFKFLLDISGN